jgi:hypothetical protein
MVTKAPASHFKQQIGGWSKLVSTVFNISCTGCLGTTGFVQVCQRVISQVINKCMNERVVDVPEIW